MTQEIQPIGMYVMFDLKSTDKGIFYWENVISYPKRVVELIEELNDNDKANIRLPKWQEWFASDDGSTKYGRKKMIFAKNKKNPTGDKIVDQQTLYLINSFETAPYICADLYAKMMQIPAEEINLDLETFSLNSYDAGIGMGPHVDAYDPNGTGSNLKYTLVTYLNDDYEGGEIYFPNQDITIKPKAGSLVMFPSGEPYMHEAKPVKSGKKYLYTVHWKV